MVQQQLYRGAVPAIAVDVDVLARVGVALADETRRRLLLALLDGPRYPAELAAELGLGRANTSNHLACLRGCGLVVAEPEGRRVRYELADRRLARALRDLSRLLLAVDPDCSHGR
ncbi:winged helix-turn-helix domain-containing protein [soil metagenome]